MNHETELKIQAWVDGDLSAVDARVIQDLIARDPEAKALAEELRWTRQAIAAGEVSRPVADSREFYWSRIEQRIRAEEKSRTAVTSPSWVQRWIRFLAPAAILAALTLVIVSPGRFGYRGGFAGLGEFENPRPDTTAFTFRSESEGMTVVWLSTPLE